MFGLKGPSGFSSYSTAEEVTQGIDGSDLTAIVTVMDAAISGASSGIGTETARILALRGVHVVMAVRNMSAGREIKKAILKQIPSAKVDAMELDVSSIASINNFAFKSSGLPLNLLVPFSFDKSLLEIMKKNACESSKEGRSLNVSSCRHQFSYHEGIHFDKINGQSG